MGQEGLADAVTLNAGTRMPRLGLGVWNVSGDAETEKVVLSAISLGYLSIDTARAYGNEIGVGRAIRACGVPRDRLFVTTKLWNDDIRRDRVAEAFEESLRDLGLAYVDLYLVHWPITGRIVSTWRVMERLYRSGRARAIGVSNHLEQHLNELLASTEVVPAVNQIEFHPYLQSPSLVAMCRQHGIAVEAWSPLMQGGKLLADPVLTRIAREHGRTTAQIVLRWEIQHGVITIPKSALRKRQEENAALFDFNLSDADMTAIAVLDRRERCGPDPLNFSF